MCNANVLTTGADVSYVFVLSQNKRNGLKCSFWFDCFVFFLQYLGQVQVQMIFVRFEALLFRCNNHGEPLPVNFSVKASLISL